MEIPQGTCHVMEEEANQRKFLDWAGEQLGVKQFSDWNNVTLLVFYLFLVCFKCKGSCQIGG